MPQQCASAFPRSGLNSAIFFGFFELFRRAIVARQQEAAMQAAVSQEVAAQQQQQHQQPLLAAAGTSAVQQPAQQQQQQQRAKQPTLTLAGKPAASAGSGSTGTHGRLACLSLALPLPHCTRQVSLASSTQ